MKYKRACNAFQFHEEIWVWGAEQIENTQTEMQGMGPYFLILIIW